MIAIALPIGKTREGHPIFLAKPRERAYIVATDRCRIVVKGEPASFQTDANECDRNGNEERADTLRAADRINRYLMAKFGDDVNLGSRYGMPHVRQVAEESEEFKKALRSGVYLVKRRNR